MSELALSALFEHLYYGYTTIINILILFFAGIHVRLQNLTSQVDLRAVSVMTGLHLSTQFCSVGD